ncbi:hypothetical protein JCM10212_006202 [Sporobolomyces blumeae]
MDHPSTLLGSEPNPPPPPPSRPPQHPPHLVGSAHASPPMAMTSHHVNGLGLHSDMSAAPRSQNGLHTAGSTVLHRFPDAAGPIDGTPDDPTAFDDESSDEIDAKPGVDHGSRKDASGARGTNGRDKRGTKRASAGGNAGEGETKLDKHGNVKKKRKQLVACDSCRLRRVKCDKSEKNGDPCSECDKKKITCTSIYVSTKPKTVRSGKLIQQAKAMFGDDPAKHPPIPIEPHIPVSSHPDPPPPVSALRSQSPHLASHVELVAFPSNAQNRLVQSQLSHDISSELINTYFDVIHPVCPLVDHAIFDAAWNLAGRSMENLSPANECLAAVLQAWAARVSDNPLIVGYGAPSLDELRTAKLGNDFTIIGNRREEFASAMRDRALRLVDERGALRTASAASCSAMTLLEFLVTWDDTSRVQTNGRYLMVAACEHLRCLNDGQCDDISEQIIPPEQLSNGTLLWMIYTRDALVALLGGRSFCLSEDDLTSLCDLFTNPITADVMSYVTSTDARMLSGLAVASIFRHVVVSVRSTVVRLTGPLARRQRVEEATVDSIWSEIDGSSRLAAIFRQSVDTVSFGPNPPKTSVWFRDLVGIKAQHLLGIHRNLCNRLDDEEAASKNGAKDGGAYLDMLRRLKDRSDERLLGVSREWTAMIREYGGEAIFAAFFTVEYMGDYLRHMFEMPSLEQGGSRDWPWARKVEEIGSLLDTVKLVGWVWSGYDRTVEYARQSLARQASRLAHQREASAFATHQQQYAMQPAASFQHSISTYSTHAPAPQLQTQHQSWAPHAHALSNPHPHSQPTPPPPAHAYTSPAPPSADFYEPADHLVNFPSYQNPTTLAAPPDGRAGYPTHAHPPAASEPLFHAAPPSTQSGAPHASTAPAYYQYHSNGVAPSPGLGSTDYSTRDDEGGRLPPTAYALNAM